MDSFRFWQRWLLVMSLAVIIFGMVFAFFSDSAPMDRAINRHVDPVFWPDEGIPESVVPFRSWMSGVLGGTLAGWGVFMAFLIQRPFKAREKWAWQCAAAGLAVWFVIDTGMSAYHHVTFNVLFNTAFLILFAIPLLFTRKHFSK